MSLFLSCAHASQVPYEAADSVDLPPNAIQVVGYVKSSDGNSITLSILTIKGEGHGIINTLSGEVASKKNKPQLTIGDHQHSNLPNSSLATRVSLYLMQGKIPYQIQGFSPLTTIFGISTFPKDFKSKNGSFKITEG